MATPKFECIEHGMEDDFEFKVNGETVGRTNYDDHGSQGMRDFQSMFEKIAAQFGVEVEEKMADE